MVVVPEPTSKKWLFCYRRYEILAKDIKNIKVKGRQYPDYNDWIRVQTPALLRFLKVITMVVTVTVSILDNYSEFIYKV